MSDASAPAIWFYVGHYGQLGPLTLPQMEELAVDGVIAGDTYVWRQGMTDWVSAGQVDELRLSLGVVTPDVQPPSTPSERPMAPPPAPAAVAPVAQTMPVTQQGAGYNAPAQSSWQYIQTHAPKSDKNRVLAGILNILIPGVGRLYMGYAAHGILQLFLTMCGGIGYIWSVIDGIYILAGGVKLDGYGRRLED